MDDVVFSWSKNSPNSEDPSCGSVLATGNVVGNGFEAVAVRASEVAAEAMGVPVFIGGLIRSGNQMVFRFGKDTPGETDPLRLFRDMLGGAEAVVK